MDNNNAAKVGDVVEVRMGESARRWIAVTARDSDPDLKGDFSGRVLWCDLRPQQIGGSAFCYDTRITRVIGPEEYGPCALAVAVGS